MLLSSVIIRRKQIKDILMIIFLQMIGTRYNNMRIIRLFLSYKRRLCTFESTPFRHTKFYINAFIQKTAEQHKKILKKIKHNQISYKVIIKWTIVIHLTVFFYEEMTGKISQTVHLFIFNNLLSKIIRIALTYDFHY